MKQEKPIRLRSDGNERCCNKHLDCLTLGMHIDGELQGVRLDEVEAHLESCALCREKAQSLAALGEGLRCVPNPAWDIEAMVGLVEAEIRSMGRRRAARVWRRSLLPLAAAAAALVILLTSVSSSAFRKQMVKHEEVLIRSHYAVSSSHAGEALVSSRAWPMRGNIARLQMLEGWR